MNHKKRHILLKYLLLLVVILFAPRILTATDYYAVVNNGSWGNAATWDLACGGGGGAGIPGAGDNAIICAGINVNVDANQSCSDLTVNGTLSILGNRILAIGNNVILNSPALLQGDNGAADVNVTGNFTINDGSTINGSARFNVNVTGDFVCNAGAGISSIGQTDLTISGNTTINGDFTFTLTGAGNKSFRAITVTATGVWDNTVGEDPRMNGNLVNNGSWVGCTGGACNYDWGRTVVGSYTISGNPVNMSHIRIENGTTLTNLGTVIVDGNNTTNGIINRNGAGNVTFNNGDGVAAAVLYVQDDNATGINTANLTFNASFTNNTVYFSRNGNQNIRIPDDNCYYNLVCKTSGTKTVQAGTTGIRNMLTIEDAAIVDVGTNTLNDGCGGTPGLTMTGTSELIISKCGATVPELTGTYTLTGGTITLNGVCAQTLRGGKTYYNLQFSGNNAASTVNMTGVLAVNGNITVSNTDRIIANSAFTMDCSKTFTYSSTGNTTLTNNITIGNFSHTNTGDVNDGGNTINVCGTSWSRSSATANFVASGRVVFNPSSGTCSVTSSAGANITQFRSITISAGKILVGDANGMNIGSTGGADFTNDGTFTHNSGTVTVVGNTSVLGTQVTTFNNLTINNTFTLTGYAANMIIEGNWTNNNGAGGFTHNNGTVTFLGGNAQTITKGGTETFYRLTVNKTAGTILTSAATTIAVTNLLTMTEGIFDINTTTLNGAGGFTANGGDLQIAKIATVPELTGTYTVNAGTVTLDGAGNQTLRGAAVNTYYNLVLTTSGVKTINNLTTINGDVTVGGSATINNNNAAFIQASDKTFNYNSTGATTLANNTNITVGSFSQTSGTFNNGTNSNFILTGTDWSKTGGVFTTAGSGRVIFQGGSPQTFYETAATTFTYVTINNANGVTLNSSNMSISGNLTFTSGNINTGTNTVILTLTTATVTQTSGFVDGNLQKNIPAGAPVRTFEVGDGTDYAPINFTFAGAAGGNLTCSAVAGQHPDIYSSDVDPNKIVNFYWTMIGTPGGSATVTFNYPSSAVDAGATPSNFSAERYNVPTWATLTISGVPTSTATTISGLASYAGDYILGEKYNPNGVYNAVTGAMNWSVASNWIRYRTGNVTTSTASTAVTGAATKFTTELAPGDIIVLQSSPAVAIGTVASIFDDLNLTLTANAAANSAGASYGISCIPSGPGVNDQVNIGNPALPLAPVTVTLDISASVNMLTFTSMGVSNILTHSGANALTIVTNANINQANAGFVNTWNISGGTASTGGNVTIGNNSAVAGRVARVNLTAGTLTIGNNLVFWTTTAANAILDLSAGACRVNLAGSLNLLTTGTFTAGATSSFNYNRTAGAQTVNLGVNYANLLLNNTSGAGATITANITAANVIGDVRIQSGLFTYGSGRTVTGNATKTFEVSDGATFTMTGTAAFPTGFGTWTFGTTSNTRFQQTTAWLDIPPYSYGNLYSVPAANVTQEFGTGAGQTVTVKGNLTCGNGTQTSICNFNSFDVNVAVLGNVALSANATITESNAGYFRVGGDFTNTGGTYNTNNGTITFNGGGNQQINGTVASQTYYNMLVDKTGGVLSCGGSVATLVVNNLTINNGTFDAPPTLTMNTIGGPPNNTLTLNGGTLNSGANINIRGDWTNNGGTFNGGTGTVTFTNGNNQNINGSAATQTFNHLTVSKSGGTLTVGVNTTTLNVNNFTQTSNNFNVSAATTAFNVNGNFLHTAGTFTPSDNIYIKGNVTNNGAGLTWGTNVTLNGTAQQTISGTAVIPNFTNLTINNTDDLIGQAILLSGPITVTGTLTLTDGHLATDATNILTLTAAAPNPTLNAPVTQDSSFVKGPMIQQKNTTASETLIFPVGKDDNMHRIELTVTHSSTTSTNYTAEYINSSATALGWTVPGDPSIAWVSGIGHWDITKGGAGSSVTNASVNLYYLTSDQVTEPLNLRVAKGNPSAWSDIGGTGTGAPTGNIVSTVNFTTFSRFALANVFGGNNPLPIELLSFDATLNNDVVDLNWATATETNNEYFTVEKTSDGKEFEAVATVKSAGNSSSVTEYKTTDENPYKGISYYRLKQTDFDGTFTYSDMVAVDNTKRTLSEFIVFPNPSDGTNINVSIKGFQTNEEILVVLNDIDGREVYSKVVVTDDNGSFVTAIDVENRLPAGVYFVVGSSRNDIFSRKLVIR